MKNRFLLILILSIPTIVVFSQKAIPTSKNSEANFKRKDTTIITGFAGIEENGYPVSLKILDFITVPDPSMSKIYESTMVNGFFKFKISIDYPSYIILKIFKNKGPLQIGDSPSKTDGYWVSAYLLEPGDSIHLEIQNQAIIFSGLGAEKFKFRQELFENSAKKDLSKSVDFSMKLDEYDSRFNYWDSLKSNHLALLNKYRTALSHIAFEILLADIVGYYEDCKARTMLIIFNRDFNIRMLADKIFRDKILTYKSNFPLTDAVAYSLWHSEYLYFRMKVDYYLIRSKFYLDTIDWHCKNLYQLIDFYFTGLIKERLMTRLFIQTLTKGYDKEAEKCILNFLHNAENQQCKRLVSNVYNGLKQSSVKGKPLIEFQLKDKHGNLFQSTSLKGKVILLDFWFTGCTGCKQIAPSLEKVKDAFKDNPDVVFLNISIDKNKAQWLKSVESGIYGKGGISLYTDGKGDDHPLILSYKISAYPRLMLIDKMGNLFNGHAPIPASDNGKLLIKEINDALKKS